MMKKIYWVVIVLAILVFAGLNNNKSIETGEKETIKIGFTIPLTGDLGYITANVRAITLFAEKEINSRKDNKYNYEFIIEDNGFDGKKAALTANKLISVDKVNALMSVSSKVGNVVSPIADQAKLIHINPFASDNNIAKGKYNFVNWTQPEEQCEKLIDLFKKSNIKTVVTYISNDAGAIAVADVCDEYMKNNNIVNHSVVSNYSEKDFRTVLQQNKDKNPDIYFLLHYPPAINLLTKQMRQNNINTPITSIEALNFVGEDSNFDDVWFVTSAEIKPEYIDIFNKSKVNDNIYGVGHSYDTINMLVDAFETVGKDSDKLAEYLMSIKDYQGSIGKISVDENGVFNSEAIAKIKKGNQFLPYEANL